MNKYHLFLNIKRTKNHDANSYAQNHTFC